MYLFLFYKKRDTKAKYIEAVGGVKMIVNGKELDFQQGITVEKMLEELNISREKVVVEINMEILDRDKFKDRILSKEDKVEIVAFVGGG